MLELLVLPLLWADPIHKERCVDAEGSLIVPATTTASLLLLLLLLLLLWRDSLIMVEAKDSSGCSR